MLSGPCARPCLGTPPSLQRPSAQPRTGVARARPESPPRDHLCGPFDHDSEALLEDQALRASPLRRVALSFTTAACSGAALPLPCRAIVEEKLTGSPAYKPSNTELGWEVIVGAVVATIPLIVASYEFGKRILIQRRCPACKGSGLITRGRYLRKCSQCGGFLPWQGWKTFFLSTAAPGNGGPLRQPRGQTGIFYKVPPKQLEAEKEERQRRRSPPAPDDNNAASDNPS